VFPPEVIDEVLVECGRVEVRHRLLPARAVVYYVLGLALFSTSSYEEVIRMLVSGHSWASGWSHEWSIPTKAALFQARRRLGSEPLRALYDKAAVPLANPQVAGDFYRSWRLMSIDGLCLDVADTEANVERFGRPASSRGEVGGAERFRKCGCSDWPSADRMRSSMPRSAPTARANRRWPSRCCGR